MPPRLVPRSIQRLPLASLHFDSQNPRLPKTADATNDTAVIGWMLENANLTELMGSIGQQDYFEGEPLIVVPRSSEVGSYEVVEGNRRLTAVKLLRNPELAPTKKKAVMALSEAAKFRPETLPCLIFDQRSEVLHFLAYRHITGVEAWKPLQKARYLRQLAKSPDFRLLQKEELRKRLALEIGSSSNYVARLLAALAVYDEIADTNNFFRIPGLSEDEVSFSVLSTAITSFGNIAHFVGMTGPTDDNPSHIKREKLEQLTKWLFEKNSEGFTRVAESRELKTLNRVLAHQVARDKFIAGTPLSDADVHTEGPAEAFRESIHSARDRLIVARDSATQISEFKQADYDVLREVQQIVRMMTGYVGERLLDKNP